MPIPGRAIFQNGQPGFGKFGYNQLGNETIEGQVTTIPPDFQRIVYPIHFNDTDNGTTKHY